MFTVLVLKPYHEEVCGAMITILTDADPEAFEGAVTILTDADPEAFGGAVTAPGQIMFRKYM